VSCSGNIKEGISKKLKDALDLALRFREEGWFAAVEEDDDGNITFCCEKIPEKKKGSWRKRLRR